MCTNCVIDGVPCPCSPIIEQPKPVFTCPLPERSHQRTAPIEWATFCGQGLVKIPCVGSQAEADQLKASYCPEYDFCYEAKEMCDLKKKQKAELTQLAEKERCAAKAHPAPKMVVLLL